MSQKDYIQKMLDIFTKTFFILLGAIVSLPVYAFLNYKDNLTQSEIYVLLSVFVILLIMIVVVIKKLQYFLNRIRDEE